MDKYVSLENLKQREVIIWHTPDFHVWSQGKMWHTVNNRLQFTPALESGFVCVSALGDAFGDTPVLAGFIIYRPRALVLSIPDDVEVTLGQANRKMMREWCCETSPWQAIRRTTRKHAQQVVMR